MPTPPFRFLLTLALTLVAVARTGATTVDWTFGNDWSLTSVKIDSGSSTGTWTTATARLSWSGDDLKHVPGAQLILTTLLEAASESMSLTELSLAYLQTDTELDTSTVKDTYMYDTDLASAAAHPTAWASPTCVDGYAPYLATVGLGQPTLTWYSWVTSSEASDCGRDGCDSIKVTGLDLYVALTVYNCTQSPRWPDDVLDPVYSDNYCTNSVAHAGETCLRVCTTDSDCLDGLVCHSASEFGLPASGPSICVCDFTTEDACGPGLVCYAPAETNSYGLCFCDPDSDDACGGSSAGTCIGLPDVNSNGQYLHVTSNLQWSTWLNWPDAMTSDEMMSAWGLANTFVEHADLPAVTLTFGSSSLWYTKTKTEIGSSSSTPCVDVEGCGTTLYEWVTTSASPGMCACNDDVSGAMCDNVIDQCAQNMCAGMGACVTTDASQDAAADGATTYFWNSENAPTAAEQLPLMDYFQAASSDGTTLYCNCSYGMVPFALTRFGYADQSTGAFQPSTACYDIERGYSYCTGRGSTISDESTVCNCDSGYAGKMCQHSCPAWYCTGRAAGDACTHDATAETNICSGCISGWGPAQLPASESVLDEDQEYTSFWCNVPFGNVSAGIYAGQQQECNGRGFAVYIWAIPGLDVPLDLQAYDAYYEPPHFETHPLRIIESFAVRGIVMTDSQQLHYRENIYNAMEHESCLICDSGYAALGAACVPYTCEMYDACDASDPACLASVSAGVALTPSVCGSAQLRGTCTLASVSTDGYSCVCNDGYAGTDCGEVRCSWANGLACGGHGTCDEATNRCRCDEGFVGAACEITDSSGACNSHGQVRRVNPAYIGNSLGETSPYEFLYDQTPVRTKWY